MAKLLKTRLIVNSSNSHLSSDETASAGLVTPRSSLSTPNPRRGFGLGQERQAAEELVRGCVSPG